MNTSPPGGLKRKLTRFFYAQLRATPPWASPKSPDIIQSRVLPIASYSPWLSDRAFGEIHDLIKGNTLVDIYRCHELWELARQVRGVPGDVLEVGVWQGGTGCLLARAVAGTGKKVFLADTFTGVAKAGERDTRYTGGEHADTSEQLVGALLARAGVDHAVILKGMFPETNADKVSGALALLHIDVDVYQSARDVLFWALPRLSPGAMVVFDDYGFNGCEGVTRLVNEFRKENAEFHFVHNLNGHALLIRKA